MLSYWEALTWLLWFAWIFVKVGWMRRLFWLTVSAVLWVPSFFLFVAKITHLNRSYEVTRCTKWLTSTINCCLNSISSVNHLSGNLMQVTRINRLFTSQFMFIWDEKQSFICFCGLKAQMFVTVVLATLLVWHKLA